MEVTEESAVLLALLSASVLAGLHLLAPHIRRLPFVPERVTASFAGGIAVAYVFLHLLPELAEGNERLGEVLGEHVPRSPLVELAVFVVALVGFVAFYGLERLAERSRRPQPVPPRHPGRADGGSHEARSGTAPGRGTGADHVFALHLGAFAVYNAVIAYTLPLSWRQSIPFAVLFTVAMGLHFVLSDRGLEEHYGSRFDRWPPRMLLAAALLAGWALSALAAPTSGVLVSVLTAFLAGSVLLNVFKEELPSARRSHFGWFVAGLVGYGLLLALVTATSEGPSSHDRDSPGTTATAPG